MYVDIKGNYLYLRNCEDSRKKNSRHKFSIVNTIHFQNLTETEVSAYELTSLQETLNEIRSSLDESNRVAFQNNIEVHLTHIMSAVSQMGTLQAFNSHNGTSV